TAFDVLVSVFNAGMIGMSWDAMLRLWIDAYESQRVEDVLLRQKLLDLAAGGYGLAEVTPGRWLKRFYNLGDVAKRNTGRVLAKDSFWRKRYALLQNLPIAQYPRDAYDYALEDSTATLETRQAQEANK